MSEDRKVCVGVISGAHGVSGLVRLHSFTEEPGAIKRYKMITDDDGSRLFKFKIKTATNKYFIAALEGVKDRNAAESLRGTKLYVQRSDLPKLRKREFYEADLVDLKTRDCRGKNSGKVIAVHNYGGGPFLEIAPVEGKPFMLPFNKECVPEVNVEEGYIEINPPEGWLNDEKPPKDNDRE